MAMGLEEAGYEGLQERGGARRSAAAERRAGRKFS
jgi:hypothetical protein